MNIAKIIIFLFAILLTLNCGTTVIKVNNSASAPNLDKPDYEKRYFSNWMGFQEYSKPVTPNKPQIFRSTWLTANDEKRKHLKPVCSNNVATVVMYQDFVDSAIHFFVGGITSSKSVLIYCSK